MTCLVSWISVDSEGPSAVYIAADSRISWGETGRKWDIGQKVFCCNNSPDILGYSGDVLFATQVLSQAVGIADMGLLFNGINEPERKFGALVTFIKDCFAAHPKYPQFPEFQIIYCTRDDSLPRCHREKFRCFTLSYSKGYQWSQRDHQTPDLSRPIAVSGSGGEPFWDLYSDNLQYLKGQSRGIFMTLCDVITKGLDQKSGGQPQLVAVYKGGNGKAIGTIFGDRRYIYGNAISASNVAVNVEWRNENFERCDGETMLVLQGAKRQPRPPELDLNLKEAKLRYSRNFLKSIGKFFGLSEDNGL